jgi:hypothetical protein
MVREMLKARKADHILADYDATGTLTHKNRRDLVRHAVSMLIEKTDRWVTVTMDVDFR